MIRTLIVLIILSLSSVMGYLIHALNLRVRLYTNTGFTETSLTTWLILSLIAAFILLLLLKILLFIWRTPQLFSRNRKIRQIHKAQRLLMQGLNHLSAGRYKKAEKQLIKGAKISEKISENAALYYEYAAQAADKLNAEDRRNQYFLRAREIIGDNQRAKHWVLLQEAESQVQNQDYTHAIQNLTTLKEKDPRNPKILNLLYQAYIGAGDNIKAWQLLPKLREHIHHNHYLKLQQNTARALIHDTNGIDALDTLRQAWKSLPEELRKEDSLLLEYISALQENGHTDEAERLLKTTLKQENAKIIHIQAYSQLRGINYKSALRFLETLEQRFKNEASYYQSLALIAYRAHALDKASQYIEQALKLQESPSAFLLWGKILEDKGENEAALIAYRQGVKQQLTFGTVQGELIQIEHKGSQ